VNRLKAGQPSPALKQMCDFVDRAYKAMEQIQTSLVEKGPIFKPFEGDPASAPKGGDMERIARSMALPQRSSGR